MPKIWDILKTFKDLCQKSGWETSENEDWIKIDGKYHSFLYTRNVNLSSFQKVLAKHKCIVPEGLSYQIAEAAYTAWLFSETPSINLLKSVSENPDFSKKVAVYDLSCLLAGKNQCARLNNTDSAAFCEFDNFLQNKLKVKFKTLSPVSTSPHDMTITELA
jgi:hypothetical protein